jgi:Zn-dependent protease with chaperone function
MPMHTYPWIRSVLMMLAALVAGTLVSVATLVILNTPLAFLEGLLKIRLPILSGQLALPLALLCAVPAYRLAEGWMVRRADRRAAVLLGDAELVTQVAAKLAATRMAPWKWGRVADEAPAAPAAASPETAPA